MREIKECSAEVFRRSEKRIKERKRNRSRILALCIPLFLMVSVWSVMTIPAMLSINDKTVSVEEKADIEGAASFSSAAFVRVEMASVATAQSTILKEDAHEAAQIYQMMQSVFVYDGAGDDNAESDVVSDENENKDFSRVENTAASGYQVTFTAENGVKTVFLITKDTLIDESNGRKAALTEERRLEILTALGLTVEWEEEP